MYHLAALTETYGSSKLHQVQNVNGIRIRGTLWNYIDTCEVKLLILARFQRNNWNSLKFSKVEVQKGGAIDFWKILGPRNYRNSFSFKLIILMVWTKKTKTNEACKHHFSNRGHQKVNRVDARWWIRLHAFAYRVCIYVWMHVCMYVCMQYTYACMYACMRVCLNACRYACTYSWMYACMHVCMYVRMCVCTYRWIYGCMYVKKQVCMHVCM